MRKILIVFAGLFLIGCEEQGYYSKENITGEQMAEDLFDCALKIGNVGNKSIPILRLEQLCMKSKGYKVHIEKIPEDFVDITKD